MPLHQDHTSTTPGERFPLKPLSLSPLALHPLSLSEMRSADGMSVVTADQRRLRHDLPVRLPASRGPVSEALIQLLDRDPDSVHVVDADLLWTGPDEQALRDEDLQLALWLSYELHYRGLAGIDDDWEWQPQLLEVRQRWERSLIAGLRAATEQRYGAIPDRPTPATVVAALSELAGSDEGRSLSRFLMRDASSAQFAEFLVHRSLYHLKEADPHTWAIPRLAGSVKAAIVTVQLDEYGLGALTGMHAQLFRHLMLDWNLQAEYGCYVDQAPAVTLLASNLMSMFGLRRRWRGALVGHLALFEMTSTAPNARYARGHRRLGGGEEAAEFFDEHVVADAAHEQIAAHQLAGGLARTEPQIASDIVFGARCAAVADQLFTDHLLDRWEEGRTSLRVAGPGIPA
jgi:hypothetical protein